MCSSCGCLGFLSPALPAEDTNRVKNIVVLKAGYFDNASFITYNKGKRIEEFYNMDLETGTCSFGTVRQATKKVGGTRVYAVKAISKGPQTSEMLRQEIEILKLMDHPNIIKLYEVFEDAVQMQLVLELCTGGDLFDRIVEEAKFTEHDAACLMEQMVRGVNYMHALKLTHRDLKPENFIFQDRNEQLSESPLKIIDFGLCCTFTDGQLLDKLVGTTFYVAPEVLEGAYNHMADMWSLGAIMFVILCGYPPFHGENDSEVQSAVKLGTFQFDPQDWNGVTEDAKTLIRNLLKKEKAERYSAKTALNDVWVKNHAPKATSVHLGSAVVDKLRGYRNHNKLKKAAIQFIARKIDDEHIKEMRDVFMSLDIDGDGHLTKDEILQGFTAAGIKEIPKSLDEFMKAIDSDGNGDIEYSEFLAASLDREHFSTEASIREAFNFFDKDGDGTISKDELREVFKDEEVQTDDGDVCKIEDLMVELDKNGDGEIDFDEFWEMMTM